MDAVNSDLKGRLKDADRVGGQILPSSLLGSPTKQNGTPKPPPKPKNVQMEVRDSTKELREMISESFQTLLDNQQRLQDKIGGAQLRLTPVPPPPLHPPSCLVEGSPMSLEENPPCQSQC